LTWRHFQEMVRPIETYVSRGPIGVLNGLQSERLLARWSGADAAEAWMREENDVGRK